MNVYKYKCFISILILIFCGDKRVTNRTAHFVRLFYHHRNHYYIPTYICITITMMWLFLESQAKRHTSTFNYNYVRLIVNTILYNCMNIGGHT